MRADRLRNVVFAADLEAGSQRDRIFDRLCCAVAGRRQVRMSRVADLDHPCSRRSPAGLWISPQKFEIHNRVFRCALDEFFEYRGPFLRARHLVESFKDYFLIDLIVP
jgi:hypothetical protein